MTRFRRPEGDRLTLMVERAGAALGVIAVLLMVGVGMVVRRRGAGPESVPRSPAEQRAMLADGRCAVRPNGDLAGKLVAPPAAGRSHPNGGYALEAIDSRRVFQAGADEVSIVPCSTLSR